MTSHYLDRLLPLVGTSRVGRIAVAQLLGEFVKTFLATLLGDQPKETK